MQRALQVVFLVPLQNRDGIHATLAEEIDYLAVNSSGEEAVQTHGRAAALGVFVPEGSSSQPSKIDGGDLSRGEVVDPAGDANASRSHKSRNHRRRFGQKHSLMADILAHRANKIATSLSEGGTHVEKQRTDLPGDFFAPRRSGNGAARRVTENVKDFRTEDRRAEFKTCDDLWIGHVAGDTRHEDVAKSLIENDFDWDTGIGAAQKSSDRSLPGRHFLQSGQIAIGRHDRAASKPAIAFR